MSQDFSASPPVGVGADSVFRGDQLEEKDWEPWQIITCTRCGRPVRPYGGFGGTPEWKHVGKYRCCADAFYLDPRTGQEYVRTRRHLRKVGSAR
jgi:hypothetical protein